MRHVGLDVGGTNIKLVVLDGRMSKNGQRLISDRDGLHTIVERLIDMRPTVKDSRRTDGPKRWPRKRAKPKRAR